MKVTLYFDLDIDTLQQSDPWICTHLDIDALQQSDPGITRHHHHALDVLDGRQRNRLFLLIFQLLQTLSLLTSTLSARQVEEITPSLVCNTNVT